MNDKELGKLADIISSEPFTMISDVHPVIYLHNQLKRITIRIEDENGARLSIPDLADSILRVEQTGMYSVLSSFLFHGVITEPHRNPLSASVFNLGFLYGLLFERLRNRKGLVLKIEQDDISAEDMASIVAHAGEDDDEEDEE